MLKIHFCVIINEIEFLKYIGHEVLTDRYIIKVSPHFGKKRGLPVSWLLVLLNGMLLYLGGLLINYVYMQKSKLHDSGIEGNRICTNYLLLLLFENFFSCILWEGHKKLAQSSSRVLHYLVKAKPWGLRQICVYFSENLNFKKTA